MMDKFQALNAFWNGFGLPAYDETSVPDDAKLPYITYDVKDDDFNHSVMLNASIWYRSTSWMDPTIKEMEISDFITRGGRMIAYDGGGMWIQKGSPWAQRMSDPSDDFIRRILLSYIVEFI